MTNPDTLRKCYLDGKTGRGPFLWDSGKPRPNILLISVDMLAPEFTLRTHEKTTVNTPNIDSLRRGGVFFANTFATSPLCTPSRASYLTGRHSYITSNAERGHDGHSFHLRDGDILFPEYLKATGYHCRHAGKCHVGSRRFVELFGENDAPWDRWSPPWYDDEQYLDFLKARGFGRFGFERRIYGEAGAGQETGNFYGGWIAAQGQRPFPKELSYPAFLVDRAISILEARPEAKPFYLQLDFFAPHQPFALPSGLESREAELRGQITVPDSFRRLAGNDFSAPWPEPRVYRLYRKNWGLRNDQTLLDYRVANQLQFELIDEVLGRLLSYLRKEGIYDNTWIFFLADHGEMNGELGLIDKGAYLHPRVIRVPLVFKPPADFSLPQLGQEVAGPCSLLDLAATLLEIAGIETPERMDGVGLLTAASGASRPQDKPILFEVWNHVVPNPCVGTVFTADDGRLYSYLYNATDELDELYLLGAEEELYNRIEDPQLKKLRIEAIQTLTARMQADPRWFGYSQYLLLEYADLLPRRSGNRQLFVGENEMIAR